jgi:putative transposase
LRDLIERIQAQRECAAYGYRRIVEELRQEHGIHVNSKRVRRVMRENGLKALIWKGFKVKTTDSDHLYGYAPNLLTGRTINRADEVWVADLTYVRIAGGFVYLACVMDLFTRKIVGYSLSDRLEAEVCLRALDQAIQERKPRPGLIHHSDRGVQYACTEYRDRLSQHGILASMSAKGYCFDNAFMESFFKSLKAEEVYLTEYETKEDVEKSIPQFIEEVYNRKRKHSSLGYRSPETYEELAKTGQLKKLGLPQSVEVTP